MNRNQKIALGCGGAGCLGLIVVAIAGGLIYFFVVRSPARRSYNYNYNVSTNRNSNSNDNSDLSSNSNDNTNDNSSSSDTTRSDSTLSDDDKHKLYQAAGMTGDAELIRRVSIKIGLMDEDYTPGENFQTFVQEHASWALSNTDFIQSVNTEAKARAYIQTHMPD
jgi:hypothetical protein